MYIYIKYYLRSFFVFGFIFIMIPVIRTYFWPSPYISFSRELLIGLIEATTASLILGSLHIHSVRKSFPGADLAEALKVFHTKCVEIDEPFEAAYDKSVTCLQELRRYKIKEMDPAKGWIKAKAGLSWESFGETVTLAVESVGERRTRIEVSSRPMLVTTVIDYGKNYKNVETIIRCLQGSVAA